MVGIRKDKSLSSADELRRNAEERLQERTVERHLPRTDEVQRLVHELEVHQIELEMQNEELCRGRDEADRTLESNLKKKEAEALARRTVEDAEVFALQLVEDAAAKALLKAEEITVTSEEALALARGTVEDALALARKTVEEAEFLAHLTLKEAEVLAHRKVEEAEALARRAVEDAEALQFVKAAAVVARLKVVKAAEVARLKVVKAADVARLTVFAFIGKRQIEETNKALTERIANDAEKLRQQNEMLILQDRLAVMGVMINNIAHQWNQPLNTLGLIVQQLPLYYGMGEFTKEFLLESTEKAMDLVQYMSQTIEDFRSLFKDEKEAIAFSVNEVIARTLSIIGKTFKDQRINVVFRPEGNPMATGFPNEYSQVLMNILLNARDALIERKVDDALISIHAYADRDKSVVTITDNAGGIAEEIIDKLFDAYFTTKADKGTGIGLFMSKSITEKSMGGKLTVRNTVGGAEFRIEI